MIDPAYLSLAIPRHPRRRFVPRLLRHSACVYLYVCVCVCMVALLVAEPSLPYPLFVRPQSARSN